MIKIDKKNRKLLFEIVGWLGATLVIGSYALVSFKVLSVDDLSFHIMNLIGACRLLTISLFKRTHQTALVNLVLAIVAVIAIINIFI